MIELNTKKRIKEIVILMNKLNWKWLGERVSIKMFTEKMNELIREIKTDKNVISRGTGGITVSRDRESPHTIHVSFEISLDFIDD